MRSGVLLIGWSLDSYLASACVVSACVGCKRKQCIGDKMTRDYKIIESMFALLNSIYVMSKEMVIIKCDVCISMLLIKKFHLMLLGIYFINQKQCATQYVRASGASGLKISSPSLKVTAHWTLLPGPLRIRRRTKHYFQAHPGLDLLLYLKTAKPGLSKR